MNSKCRFNLTIVLMLFLVCCSHHRQNGPIPVLSSQASMKKMQLVKGFSIKLVASEPLINTPVAMTFDDGGRIWVVEMSDYQPINGPDSSSLPLGKIVILSDTSGNGIMNYEKIFLDSLIMPRAICLVDGGVLVASPPNLWFYKINNDKPGERVLVDSTYTVSDNVEGQTNGLLVGLDNWIYSAGFGSNKRYRMVKGKWITQRTFLRGQWGITQDSYGHLFYNNNSVNLLGDYFLPGVTNGNKYQRSNAGFNQRIVPDNRVYPAGPTPGVNRGYQEGVLDSNRKLEQFTAACGPLIYNGGVFPKEYEGNAFVCEPAANLIKRDILQYNNDSLKITGKEAYIGKEFLASTDKRFRPVNLYNGPDGALYVVDMYRGVIQDTRSLTDYLKNYSLQHGLNIPINCGRIYKIFPEGVKLLERKIPGTPQGLVSLLTSSNEWVRERAQQKIVDNQYLQLVPALKQLLLSNNLDIYRTRALWTLEGLNALTKEDLESLLQDNNMHLKIQSLTAMISIMDKNNYNAYMPIIRNMLLDKNLITDVYLTYVVGKLYSFAPIVAEDFWKQLLSIHSQNKLILDAILSSIQGNEGQFVNKYRESALFHEELDKIMKHKKELKSSKNVIFLKRRYPKGYAIFTGTCQTCHGADGNGIKFFGPPLNGSNWVNGDKNVLIPIVLYGVSGPIKVNSKIYVKPNVIGEMPGWNNAFSDTALAEVISFIRQAWLNKTDSVSINDILQTRQKYKGREAALTMKELNGLSKK